VIFCKCAVVNRQLGGIQGKVGGAINCRVNNRKPGGMKIEKGEWLLKAIGMVRESTASRKKRQKLTGSSEKFEQKWRG
jgi:hypothetical protein